MRTELDVFLSSKSFVTSVLKSGHSLFSSKILNLGISSMILLGLASGKGVVERSIIDFDLPNTSSAFYNIEANL